MKISWLKRSGNRNLIIFFSGWGIEPSDMEFLKAEKFDVVMLHGFTHNHPEFNFCGYEHKIILAFSFGVFLSSIIPLNVDENYAFNGTLKPVDNNFGIRESIFKKTFENLSPETLEMFWQNMFDNRNDSQRFIKNRIDPDINELKQQLELINELSSSEKIATNFDKVFVSKNDRIIPYKNQVSFWSDKKTEIVDSGHFPFYKFSSWDEIVTRCRK